MKKALLVLVTVLLVVSCKSGKNKKEPDVVVDTTPIVKTEIIENKYMRESIRLSGDVEVINSVDIFPDVAGKVHSLKVSEGDFVKKGTSVAFIDRNKPGMTFALSPVESPISGTITSVLTTQGAMASPSMPIFKIGTLDQLELVTYISERDINRVKKGQNAILTTDTYPENEFIGTVYKLNPVVNPKTRSLKVNLTIKDDNNLLKPGMFINMELVTKEKEKTIVVNKESLITRNNKNFLWLFKDGKVFLTPVTLGLINEKEVEITSGVSVGDEIVTEGFTYLEEGSSARTLEKENN